MAVNRRDTESFPVSSLAVVVGANCKLIRSEAGVTQNTLALHAQSAGLLWNTGKVAQFERGQYDPRLTTLFAVSFALSKATDGDVTLADLFKTPDKMFVELTDKLVVHGRRLAEVACSEPWGEMDDDERTASLVVEVDAQLRHTRGLDEYRLAKRLGITADRLAAESHRLWGRAFSDERDRRAGADANAQKRGQVTRTLQADLEKALADGDDQ